MKVYRITLAKWANTLYASGYAGRWNSNGVFMLYTSSSRALASLENIVHRSGEGLNQAFRCMVIDVPDTIPMSTIETSELHDRWFEYENYRMTQAIGDLWIRKAEYAILKVPSAIVTKEQNYLVNPNHPLFNTISIEQVEVFDFDPRLIK